jgi:hypothetical protein
MNDAEPTIKRLLESLRDAQPHPGIEHRILKAMQAREQAASVPWWNRLRPQTLSRFAIGMAGALAVIGAFVAMTLPQRRKVPVDAAHPVTLAVGAAVGAAVGVTRDADAIPLKAPVPVRRPASRILPKHAHAVTPTLNLRSASFPAPPLPLTEQEKLLLRLTRRRNPEDTAILNPAVQAAQSAKANEQFQQFFGMNDTEMRNQIE